MRTLQLPKEKGMIWGEKENDKGEQTQTEQRRGA
jgi:hypothetical protein